MCCGGYVGSGAVTRKTVVVTASVACPATVAAALGSVITAATAKSGSFGCVLFLAVSSCTGPVLTDECGVVTSGRTALSMLGIIMSDTDTDCCESSAYASDVLDLEVTAVVTWCDPEFGSAMSPGENC